MNRLMRATLLAFVVSLAVWGLIAVWTQIRMYELLRTWCGPDLDLEHGRSTAP
jgi:hypothetical protein